MALSRLSGALAVLVAIAAAPSARAACDNPEWDLARVADLLQATTPGGDAGAFDRTMPGAVKIDLAPAADVSLELAPERPPKNEGSFAAVLRFAAGEADTFEIALSDAAWIDVVQNGAYVASGDFIGIHDCPGVRKIVSFDIGPEPFALQLSDATTSAIAVAIVPAR